MACDYPDGNDDCLDYCENEIFTNGEQNKNARGGTSYILNQNQLQDLHEKRKTFSEELVHEARLNRKILYIY